MYIVHRLLSENLFIIMHLISAFIVDNSLIKCYIIDTGNKGADSQPETAATTTECDPDTVSDGLPL